MRKTYLLQALFLMLVFIADLRSNAQSIKTQDIAQSLRSMADSVLVLQKKYGTKNRVVAAKLREISSYVGNLRAAVSSEPTKTQPERYAESLSSLARLLRLLADGRYAKSEILKKLDEVSADLALKVAFIKSSRGEPFAQVEAVIRTLREDKEISGYEVWYVPKGLAEYPDEHRRFDNLSSPAVMELPPGNYLIWATKGRSASERRPLTLGEDGRSKRRYDLPVQ